MRQWLREYGLIALPLLLAATVLLWGGTACVLSWLVHDTYVVTDSGSCLHLSGADVYPDQHLYVYVGTNTSGYPCQVYIDEVRLSTQAEFERQRLAELTEDQRSTQALLERAQREWKEQGIR
jgi:hypothetical protein